MRSSRISISGRACRTPDRSIASATVAPRGSESSTENTRSGSAWMTDTVMHDRSCIRAPGFGAEVVDHAVGQFLETDAEGEARHGIADFEIEVQRHLAAIVAERREGPHPVQPVERTDRKST